VYRGRGWCIPVSINSSGLILLRICRSSRGRHGVKTDKDDASKRAQRRLEGGMPSIQLDRRQKQPPSGAIELPAVYSDAPPQALKLEKP